MRRFALACLAIVLLTVVGCKGGIRVNASARVTPQVPPVGPVQATTVERINWETGTKIAIVDVDGLLLNMNMSGPYAQGDNPVALFRERLMAVSRDPCVRAVVVRINSPGGGVTASDIMRHDLRVFRTQTGLPIVACLMDVGAGGAYYLATAADQIHAHPTTITGGVGVILNIYNLSDALAQQNIIATPVKSGENIDLGSPIRGLDEAKRKLLQTMANEFHARFRDEVSAARRLSPEAQAAAFDGRVFTGRQALDLGLVDSLGYLDDAIAVARQLGGAPNASVVIYHRSTDQPHSLYAITPNSPLQTGLLPLSIPGLDRAKLPTFLYLWQPEPTMEKLGGH